MMIQVMEPEQVESLEFDPFDVTGMPRHLQSQYYR
jgi:catalase